MLRCSPPVTSHRGCVDCSTVPRSAHDRQARAPTIVAYVLEMSGISGQSLPSGTVSRFTCGTREECVTILEHFVVQARSQVNDIRQV